MTIFKWPGLGRRCRDIHPSAWFRCQGRRNHPGLHFWCISGALGSYTRVTRWETP